jgi:hypothetical protein
MLIFFYIDQMVYREFVPPAQSVNQQFYLNVLKRLHKNLGRKHPGKWQSGDWFLHHDNAPAHTALSVQQLLTGNKTVVVSHPPTHPNLLRETFFLYTQMKQDLNGRHFADIAEAQRESLTALDSIPLKILDYVSSSGSSAGITASSHQRNTLK